MKFSIPTILVLMPIIACSPKSDYTVESVKPSIQIISAQEQAKMDLQDVPTTFLIPFDKDTPTWERCLEFYKTLLKSKYAIEDDPFTGRRSISGGTNNGSYIFEILREKAKGGYVFSVRVNSKNMAGNPQEADQNARNLSRFLRDGSFEMTLLKP